MAWFTKDYIAFFLELAHNNNREWFQENKKRYEQSVKEPFEQFISDLIAKIAQDDANIKISPKQAIFRIYKDVRFSKDKTPYKTRMSALISKGGRKDMVSPGVYLELGAEGLKFYSGCYFVEKEMLLRVRTQLAKNSKPLHKIIDSPAFTETFGSVKGEKNKRLVKAFKLPAEKEPLLFNKSFYITAEMDIDMLLADTLIERVFELYLLAKPFNKYMQQFV